MSSLIHKPADLKSLHVRVSPRSSRCPSVEWGEEEKEKESGLIEGAVAGEKLVSSQWSGAVTGLGYGNSGQVEQRDNGDRDGVCIGWLGGIESKEEGDGTIFESDGSAEDVLEKAAEERKEEDRRRTRSLNQPSVTVGMKWINRRSDKYQVRDYPGSADALRGGGHVTPAPLSGMVSQMNGGAVPSSSGAKGGVSGGSSVSQLRASAISHWSSIPQSRVTDSGLGDNSNSGVESSFHFLGDGAPPYSIEHGGCGDEVGGIRTTMTQLESDESSSSRDNKAREMGNIIDTDPDPDTNTAEQKEQDTEERTEEGSLVGGNVTAPGGEGGRGVGGEKGGEGDSRGRGRASTVFLSLWDIAAYGTGALGARLDEIERFGLRSTGYLDESDTEDEESDGKSDSQSDTDDSEASIGIFNSHIFTRAHTSIVSASEHLKTAAQKAHSRLSLSYAYSIFAGPETSPSPLTPATLCVPEVERPDGTGAETFIDRAKGSRQQTIYEDAVFVFSPDGSQEETLDLGNLTKITAEKNDISAASPNTFISRFLAAKINFFKATPPSDGHDVRTPGLFPIIGADGDADYALNEGSSGRGSALMERSVREGRAPSSSSYLPHLPQQSAASSSSF